MLKSIFSFNFFRMAEKTKPTVVFVLGAPGAGKGTQCKMLQEEKQFFHLSAGDLLREEMSNKDSQYSELINDLIKNGKIVPVHYFIYSRIILQFNSY